MRLTPLSLYRRKIARIAPAAILLTAAFAGCEPTGDLPVTPTPAPVSLQIVFRNRTNPVVAAGTNSWPDTVNFTGAAATGTTVVHIPANYSVLVGAVNTPVIGVDSVDGSALNAAGVVDQGTTPNVGYVIQYSGLPTIGPNQTTCTGTGVTLCFNQFLNDNFGGYFTVNSPTAALTMKVSLIGPTGAVVLGPYTVQIISP